MAAKETERVSLKDGNGKTLFEGTTDEFSERVGAIGQVGTKTLYHELKLPGNPNQLFQFPKEKDFIEAESEFLSAEKVLRPFYNALFDKFASRFIYLSDAEIKLLWKQKGGSKDGRHVYGKCQRPTSLLKHYADCDFLIWLAADNCYTSSFTNWQVLALVYHEMRHTAISQSGFATAGHDYEGFPDEILIFGAWHQAAEDIIGAAKKLPGFE